MNYQQIYPIEPLRKYVRYFWILEDDISDISQKTFKIMSDGLPGPIFQESPKAFFDEKDRPQSVELMNQIFLEADVHIWLSPLYHGSIPGVMKNCLDWLQISAKNPIPYLTDKTIGMVCWADGVQAMQGINTMDAISKALRAWPLPYSVPIVRSALFEPGNPTQLSPAYQNKLNLLIQLAATKKIAITHPV